MVVEVFGWVWAICSVTKSIPQAMQCYKQGHFNGASGLSLVLWLVGLITGLLYVFLSEGSMAPFKANFTINFMCCLFQLRYYYRPRNKEAPALRGGTRS